MTNVFCVRANFGTYAKQFVEGRYVVIGWMPSAICQGSRRVTNSIRGACKCSKAEPMRT
jgi:hypothetical protein